jgi:hypothetical protein
MHASAKRCAALFALSTLFPIVAGVWNVAQPPRWLGVADVVFAALLLFSAFALVNRAKSAVTDSHRVAALRLAQSALGIIPLLLLLFFLVGDRIAWTVLVIGLAWRAWLLLYVLPFLVAAWRDAAVSVEA